VSTHSYSNFLTSLPHSKYTTGPQRIFSKQRKRFDQVTLCVTEGMLCIPSIRSIPKQPSSFKIVKEGVTSSNRDFIASGESKDKDEIMDRTGSYESPSNQNSEHIIDKWDKEVVGEAEVFDRLQKYPTQYGLSQANKTFFL
jgi:hypothetical protein